MWYSSTRFILVGIVDGCSFSGLPVKTTAVNILYFQMSGSPKWHMSLCVREPLCMDGCVCTCVYALYIWVLLCSKQRVFITTCFGCCSRALLRKHQLAGVVCISNMCVQPKNLKCYKYKSSSCCWCCL